MTVMNFNCGYRVYVGGRGKKWGSTYIYHTAILLTTIFATLFNHSLDSNTSQKMLCCIAFPYISVAPTGILFDILTPIATRGYPAIRDDTGAYIADSKRYFPSLRDLWNIFNSLEVTADRSCRSDPFQPWSMMASRGLFSCHACVHTCI